jgi:hypothetical protein
MAATNGQVIAPATGGSSWLVRRRGLVIAVAVVAAAAVALGQSWVALADLVPLLYVLPCAAMMFVCMKGMSHGQQTETKQISAQNDMPASSDRPGLT